MTNLAQHVVPSAFLSLPHSHYSHVIPSGLKDPFFIHTNQPLAARLGIKNTLWDDAQALEFLSGQVSIHPNHTFATVYSGHQFGVWAGQLGDGRALFLGDIETPNGERYELQLKGAGPTPYSRHGDGRAVLRSSIREYLASIAMQHLGIPTTHALSLVGSRTPVFRETLEYAAIVSRLAPSFIRFGHIEHWASVKDYQALATLLDWVITHHYPDIAKETDLQSRYRAILKTIFDRTCRLVAQWQSVGFCHGVLNTDNMSLLGLTLDYGPFAFMEAYQPNYICNHSDHLGRYAYQQQPKVVAWNLFCLARALSPILDDASIAFAQGLLNQFEDNYQANYLNIMLSKLGIEKNTPQTRQLLNELLKIMETNQADFTLSFRYLSSCTPEASSQHQFLSLFKDSNAILTWLKDYFAYLNVKNTSWDMHQAKLKQVNPKFILRNYLAQTAIEYAEQGDFGYISRLLQVLSNPFEEHAELDDLASKAPDWAKNISISCSS